MENPIWFPYGWTFISHLPMTGALCSGSTTGVRALVKYHETAPENRGVGRRAGRGHLASWTSPLAGKFARGFPKVDPGPSPTPAERRSRGPPAAGIRRGDGQTRHVIPRKPVSRAGRTCLSACRADGAQRLSMGGLP